MFYIGRRVLIFSLIIIFSLTLSGCKKSEDRAAEKAIEQTAEKHLSRQLGENVKVDIDQDQQKMAFTNKETGEYIQSSAQGDLSLPPEWPKEIKLYPHGKLITVMKADGMLHLGYQTEDGQPQVRKWYQQELDKLGWTVKSNIDMGDSWLAIYEKDGHQLNLVFGPNEDGSGNIITHQYNL